MTAKETWAPRSIYGNTFHAVRDGNTALCGVKISPHSLHCPEVPRGGRTCPRCVAKGGTPR
jgi:hypothetical protein